MEIDGEQDVIANADEQDHAQDRQRLVPDPPGLHALLQRLGDGPAIDSAAKECQDAEQGGEQEFVSLGPAETERLQEIQNQENDDAIDRAVPEPMAALLERIFPTEY